MALHQGNSQFIVVDIQSTVTEEEEEEEESRTSFKSILARLQSDLEGHWSQGWLNGKDESNSLVLIVFFIEIKWASLGMSFSLHVSEKILSLSQLVINCFVSHLVLVDSSDKAQSLFMLAHFGLRHLRLPAPIVSRCLKSPQKSRNRPPSSRSGSKMIAKKYSIKYFSEELFLRWIISYLQRVEIY